MESIRFCTFLVYGTAARMAMDEVLSGRSYEAKHRGNEIYYDVWLKASQLNATLNVLDTYEDLRVIKHTMHKYTFFVEHKEDIKWLTKLSVLW